MSIPSIARYLSIGRSFAPSFLGEADEVVYLGDLTGVPQVWLVPASAGCTAPLAPEQLTCGDDRVAGLWTSPVPGDRRLIYGRDAGGNERMQLHLLDVGTGEERWLTASHPDSTHDFGLWEDPSIRSPRRTFFGKTAAPGISRGRCSVSMDGPPISRAYAARSSMICWRSTSKPGEIRRSGSARSRGESSPLGRHGGKRSSS